MAPTSPSKWKRKSLLEQFPDLDIVSSGSTYEAARQKALDSLAAGMKSTFSRGWPPSLRLHDDPSLESVNLTLRMDSEYRYYSKDGRDTTSDWRRGATTDDGEVADVAPTFETLRKTLGEFGAIVRSNSDLATEVAVEEMARAVFASNDRAKEGAGLDLDETMRLCTVQDSFLAEKSTTTSLTSLRQLHEHLMLRLDRDDVILGCYPSACTLSFIGDMTYCASKSLRNSLAKF